MSYRSLIAVAAALVLTAPAFADEMGTTVQETTTTESQQMSPATTTTTTETTVTKTKVDVNKASVRDLVKVKGITAGQAKAIITYRKRNGDFKSLDDLKNVKGFQTLTTDEMKVIEDQLTAS